ncbi:polyprenol monophosphomannose synthase [Microterricola pindariensis]|uniref:Dolichol-phosphate mannosyltransferase n=1 Tax=Microterricola pindariensis TaxID=478010 RepID=A0ABX5AY77_9MICO|nr:polyprenol monophosphomannose synthase [Microterricola pindariensis]PPL19846.1 dolichol-phosphate mannosyltransferase [Microterricola pindariensis]
MTRTIVVIPTYNEIENLEAVARRLLDAVPAVELLVVDDNSPDGTGRLAEDLAAADERIHVLHRPGKDGLGAAYRAGFAWVLGHGADVVVEMDADGSHLPEQLPRLLDGLRVADVVIGSRWVPGGAVRGWPAHRKLISLAGSEYARLALGVTQRDATGGFRAFTAPALARIGAERSTSQGYGFQIETLWQAVGQGLRVVEVPITFVERVNGSSKMSAGIVVEAMLRVTVWGLAALPARVRRRRPAVAVSPAPVQR